MTGLTPFGEIAARVMAGVRDPRFGEPMPSGFDEEEFPKEFDDDEPRVPGTPREEEEFA